MKLIQMLVLFTVLLPFTTSAQTKPATSGTIEGVIVSYVMGNRSDTTDVEADGRRYEFCLGCPGSIKDSPKLVGGTIEDFRDGTRVRVTYVNLTRSRDGSIYYIKALTVIKLPEQAGSKSIAGKYVLHYDNEVHNDVYIELESDGSITVREAKKHR